MNSLRQSFSKLTKTANDEAFLDEFSFIDEAGDIFCRMVSFAEIQKGNNYPSGRLIYDYLSTDERIEAIDNDLALQQVVELAMNNYYKVNGGQ